MTQSVKCLLLKHKYLTPLSEPKIKKKKSGVLMLIPLLVEPWGTLASQPRKMGKL